MYTKLAGFITMRILDSRPDRARQALAFAYGYLTHAAGDMWAHTFVNDFSRGIFPSFTDPAVIGNGSRHFVVEGYIGRHTPPPDAGFNSIEIQSPGVTDPSDPHKNFIYWVLIADGLHGGFVDSAGLDTRLLGQGLIFTFFFRLHDDLIVLRNNPEIILTGIADCVIDPWVEDIEEGLQDWPQMAQGIAHALFSTIGDDGTAKADFGAAKEALTEYLGDRLPGMLGLDNCITEAFKALLGPVKELLEDIIEPIKDFIAFVADTIKDAIEDLVNWLMQQAVGFDLDDLKEWLTSPCFFVNSGLPPLELAPDTSQQLDALMGINQGVVINEHGVPECTDEVFPEDQITAATPFRAVRNTIVTSALVLLDPNELDNLLFDKRVGSIYRQGAPFSDRDNFMLGWIRSLDANQQWRRLATTIIDPVPDISPDQPRKNGEGNPVWLDCLARRRVFRTLYQDWQNGNAIFPDQRAGHPETFDPALNLSATPLPVSTLTVNGPTANTNGKQFVSSATTFNIAGRADHFWETSELTMFVSITDPLGVASALPNTLGPVVAGPLSGPEGKYVIDFHTSFVDCGITEAPSNKATFYLDRTPPLITYISPPAGTVLDVVSTFVLKFTAVDSGAGVASSSVTLDGKPFANNAIVDAFFLDAGNHTIVVSAADKVGNATTKSLVFSVHATIAGLLAANDKGYTLGLITISRSLNPWLGNFQLADKFLQAGKKSQAISQLQAAIKNIKSQLGTGIQTELGNRMIGWINDLIARL